MNEAHEVEPVIQKNPLLRIHYKLRELKRMLMPANPKASRVLLSSLISLCLLVVPGAAGQTPQKPIDKSAAASPMPTAPAPAAASTGASDFVGSETCKACHEDIYNSWEKTPHWKTTLDTKGGASHQGCEGCHGPGAAHVAGGGDKTKIFIFPDHSPKEINARCLTCHAGGTQHMNAINSEHSKNDVSCISCHSPHHAETNRILAG